MQIDKKRYTGYMKEDSVIRLCRNYPLGTMSQEDKLYDSPSLSGKVLTTLEKGKNILLRGVLTKSGTKWYAIQWGGRFCFVPSRYCTLKQEPAVYRLASETVAEGVGGLEKHIFRFMGEPKVSKRLTKVLDLTGKKGDTFMINAWGRGTCLPETDNDKNRRFGVEVVFVAADNTTDVHYTNFSPDILDWQFLSDIYVAKKDYSKVKISYTYCKNANTAYFDGLSLYREEFGQSYTYDSKNNLVSAVDSQKNTTKFEYNAGSDLTGITDPKGSKYTYTYDKKHNVTSGKSSMGILNRLVYDDKGNITRSGVVKPDQTEKGIWVERTFTADKNHVSAVTDAEGNKVQYEWDTSRDLLRSLTDGEGNKLSYGYDKAERLISVSQNVTVDGKKQVVKNIYTYTKDRLAGIEHNGFRYDFAYDVFGNTSAASVAGNPVVSYQYESQNGKLLKTVYANGDEIRYTYDTQERLIASYLNSAVVSEQRLNSYVYNKEGNLCRVINHLSGKTYELDYDFLDRLMRVRDESGICYEYTYDANNQMIHMQHSDGKNKVTTGYVYDSDGREIDARVSGKFTRFTDYDRMGRVDWQSLSMDAGNVSVSVAYEYPSTVGNKESSLPSEMHVQGETYSYKYDQNGNITEIQKIPRVDSTESIKKDTFQYDERNQLIRENSQSQNKTIVYAYDQGGNLKSVKEYVYTEGILPVDPVRTETGTYSSTWKDQLLKWDGISMTYDAIGNMLTRGDIIYTWTMGRKLASVNNGRKAQYFYDHTGARVKKVVDGVTTNYHMAGDLLASEICNGKTIWYIYDSGANLIAAVIDGKYYFYIRNIQNDVIALVDESGKTVVNYVYDCWGKLLSITGSLKDTIGVRNPFRYRGYYYDNETGMYYLKNRYYDPGLRRFISSDAVTTVEASLETLHNRNLYTYCNQNPVIRGDKSGNIWQVLLAGVAGAGISLGYQMVFEKKEFTVKTLAQAGLDGIAMAVGASAAKVGWQIIVNVATSVISGIMNEDDGMEIACQAVVGGVFAYVGGNGTDFAGIDRQWRLKVSDNSRIKDINIKKELNQIARNQFVRRTKREIYNTVSSTITGYGTSEGISKGYSNCRGRVIGYERHFNGKVTIYSRLYYKNKSIVKSIYRIA